jgi:hypothetical protein
VESQLGNEAVGVRRVGTGVFSAEFADVFFVAAVADSRESYGGGNPDRLYDCVPYSSVGGDWIHYKLCHLQMLSGNIRDHLFAVWMSIIFVLLKMAKKGRFPNRPSRV